ncbi:hypothetical protein Sste5346_004139 [Sporothrix stenoceras]|uniref:Calcineurin-like phosphoesterase domain-containing protein n=1 Tax=Sporothrix stenoceras TaxID=5173 RepID=A0ABR3ZC50_9PEZI
MQLNAQLATWRPPQITPWQRFRRDPAIFLARALYSQRADVVLPSPTADPIKIICISDTHNAQPTYVFDGDVLIHAGDLTNKGSFAELQSQLSWLQSLPHAHKIVIAGNHDLLLDPAFSEKYPDRVPDESGGEGTSVEDLDWGGLTYLNDSSTTLTFESPSPTGSVPSRTLRIYGAPWTEQCGLFAFQYPPVRERVWAGRIPDGTDIVVVHGPPRGHLDQGGKGCPQLLREIERAKPKLVVCGHIHEGHGREDLLNDNLDRAYHAVETGDRGLWGVAVLAGWLLWKNLWAAVWPTVTSKGTRLVNAAVMTRGWTGNADGPALREAIVVEL